ncbi:hypothetical protein [Rubinisphaera sp. JC750]|uniref:hypothetical protein n=1 Tax=Rubinisphaera sp. JC750 TaxID=2898658 RepID=UPI001F17C7EC|nr:hypothetical protein [Rubinisphaera sp. JC750]
MITFNEFVNYLWLHEVTSLFDRDGFNKLFRNELQKLISKTDDSEKQQQLIRFQETDFVGYVDRSLRNAGFRDEELDSKVSQVIQHLLVHPGKLFSGWRGQPIEGRFKLAVRNAILNLVEKRNRERERYWIGNIHQMGIPAPDKNLSQTLVDEFREFLRLRAGNEAVEILDARLSNVSMKSIADERGSSHRVKEIVKVLKHTAKEFAADDPMLDGLIRQAMEEESERVRKRVGK